MDILRPYKLNQYILNLRILVFNLLPSLAKEKSIIKFLLASLKTLNNYKDCSESPIKFLFRLSFSLIGRLLDKFWGSQAAFGTKTTFKLTAGYQKARTSFPVEGYWKDFHSEQAETWVYFWYSSAKNCKKPSELLQKILFLFLGPWNKYFFYRLTLGIPLKFLYIRIFMIK